LVNYETTLIILFSFVAIYTIVCSTSFLSLYLGLELQALSFYVLAGLQRNSAFRTEAALKYFLVGAFISGILLFGIGLIYRETGIFLFEDLNRLV
jgi:NADH-quinone oxidoreductase subunit N